MSKESATRPWGEALTRALHLTDEERLRFVELYKRDRHVFGGVWSSDSNESVVYAAYALETAAKFVDLMANEGRRLGWIVYYKSPDDMSLLPCLWVSCDEDNEIGHIHVFKTQNDIKTGGHKFSYTMRQFRTLLSPLPLSSTPPLMEDPMSYVLQSWANSKTHKNLLVFVDKNTTIPNLPERCLLFNAGPGVLDVLRFEPFNTAVYVSLCVSEEDTYAIASRYWDVTYGDPQKAPLFAKVKTWVDGLRLVPRQRASLYRSMIVGTEEQLAHLRKHDALVNLVSFSDAELVGIHKKVCSMSERNKFDAAFVCGGVSIDARIVAEDAAREVWLEDGTGPEKKGLVPRVGDGALDKIRLPKPTWTHDKNGLHVTCAINVLHNYALFEALRRVGEMDKTVQVELPNVEGDWTMKLCEWRWAFSPLHAHEAIATWTLSFLSEADELTFVKSGTTNPTHHTPAQHPLSPRRSHFIGVNDGPPVQKDVFMSLALDGKATWQPDDARIKVDQPIRIKVDQLEREGVEREWKGGVMAKATAALETKKVLDARWASQENANVDGTKVVASDLTVFPLVRQSEPRVDRAMEAIKRVGDADTAHPSIRRPIFQSLSAEEFEKLTPISEADIQRALDHARPIDPRTPVAKSEREEVGNGATLADGPFTIHVGSTWDSNFTRARTLEEFDGPILTEHLGKDGKVYVEKWCTYKGNNPQFLLVRSSPDAIAKYLDGQMSMLELFTKPNSDVGFLVECDGVKIIAAEYVQVSTLPASYLPSPTAMHDIDLRKDWTTETNNDIPSHLSKTPRPLEIHADFDLRGLALRVYRGILPYRTTIHPTMPEPFTVAESAALVKETIRRERTNNESVRVLVDCLGFGAALYDSLKHTAKRENWLLQPVAFGTMRRPDEPSVQEAARARDALIAIKTALDALVAEIMVSAYAGILTRLPVKKFIALVEKHTAHVTLPSPPVAP